MSTHEDIDGTAHPTKEERDYEDLLIRERNEARDELTALVAVCRELGMSIERRHGGGWAASNKRAQDAEALLEAARLDGDVVSKLVSELEATTVQLDGVRKTIRHFLESETSTVHILWEQRLREAASGAKPVVSKATADHMVLAERHACAKAGADFLRREHGMPMMANALEAFLRARGGQ